MNTVFRMTSKIKCLHVILGAIFSNQSRLGAIFAHSFRELAQIFREFAKDFTDFAQIYPDFSWIFPGF